MASLVLLSLGIWIALLVFRGGFWRADELLPAAMEPERWPSVAAIIPARNEAATIRQVTSAHRTAQYPGALQVFVCDDHSTDGTADQAAHTSGPHSLKIVHVPPLEPGWSGKLWALKAGLSEVAEHMPEADYILFTDADIVVDEHLLRRLMAQAERRDLGLTSIMAKLDDRGFWGGLLVPAFIFFFQKLYPFPLINTPTSHVAGAAGGVMLVRQSSLEKIGGLDAMRGALIDDCALAEKIKNTAPREPIGLYLSSHFAGVTSLRDNRSYASLETMVARTAYTQLGYNPLALVGTLVGMLIIYLVPALAVLLYPFHGDGGILVLGVATWLLMIIAYGPTLRRYGRRTREAWMLPLAALFYGWFTWLSGWRHWRGRGGQWKGRNYPAGKVRANAYSSQK
ncbi:MAG: glycosyltransferase [Pseudomonadota bacterium]